MDMDIAIGIVTIALISALVSWSAITWSKARIRWRSLFPYGGDRSWGYSAMMPYADPGVLVSSIKLSQQALSKHTKWRLQQIETACRNIHIYVMEDNSWTDRWGRKVAGLQMGYIIYVGKDLGALCHEIAHLCELEIDGEIDEKHETWEGDGINAAVSEYAHMMTRAPSHGA